MKRSSNVDRSKIWSPFRDIINYFVYRKLTKSFDMDTVEGRNHMQELRRAVDYMGYNEGIEHFERHYEWGNDLGKRIVQDELARQARLQPFYEQQAERNRIMDELKDKEDMKKMQQWEQNKKRELSKNNYNPSFVPTVMNLKLYTPYRTMNPIAGVNRKDYDIPEKGLHVSVVEINGQVKIFHGSSALYVYGQASSYMNEYVRKAQAAAQRVQQQSEPKPKQLKKYKKPKKDDVGEIDISHVNRAMGNTGNNNSNNTSDIDDIIDDIF